MKHFQVLKVRQRLALASEPELPAHLRCLHVVHARLRLRIPVLVSIDSLAGPTVLDARLPAFWTMSTKLQSREEVCLDDKNDLRVFVVRQTGTRIRAGPF